MERGVEGGNTEAPLVSAIKQMSLLAAAASSRKAVRVGPAQGPHSPPTSSRSQLLSVRFIYLFIYLFLNQTGAPRSGLIGEPIWTPSGSSSFERTELNSFLRRGTRQELS